MTTPSLNRYLLCQYVPTPEGKTNKIPLNPKTLKSYSPLAKEIHMDYATARSLANMLGESYGIGYALLEGDNYFFIDLDKCINPDGTLTELAQNTLAYFKGAYVEVSNSKRGLHIIGRFEGEAPFTGKRLDSLGVEIYISGRFCALAEINPSGDAQSIHTERLHQFIAALGLKADTDTNKSDKWTTEAEEGTNPPEDNETLINFIMNFKPNKKAESVFGGNERDFISFKDLWENNTESFSKYFEQNSERGYDLNRVEAALASRLHYFTGGNCERVLELMYLSQLKRDKWDTNANYLPHTITFARGDKFFIHDGPPQAMQNSNKKNTDAQPEKGEFLDIAQQIAYFQGCTYIADIHQILTPEGILHKPEAFNSMYGGVSFQLDNFNQKTTRKAFEAFTLSQGHGFPKAHTTAFKPLLPFGEIVTEYGTRSVNIYVPLDIPRVKESVELFLIHLEKLIPDENDRLILLSYMAALVQYKGKKFTWCVIVQGAHGNGKTLLNEILSFCMGQKYVHSPSSAQLAGQFNSWMENNLLITVDDVYQTRWDMMEILKPMITNKYLEIESKGVNKVTKEICCNFFLCSNNKDGIPKSRDDRRFAPFFTAQQSAADCERDMGGDYFPKLRDWVDEKNGFAAINEYLCTFEIPDKYNPTTKCIRAPITTSTEEAISSGLTYNEALVLNWIEECCVGFKKGWVSSILLNRKLLETNSKISPKYIPITLEKLGYTPHPNLDKGRSTKLVKMDGGQPRLYVTKDHYSLKILDKGLIADSYEKDQTP